MRRIRGQSVENYVSEIKTTVKTVYGGNFFLLLFPLLKSIFVVLQGNIGRISNTKNCSSV